MSITDVEYPTEFGALDATVTEDGSQLSAYELRTMGRDCNRLNAKGGPVLRLDFDSSTDGAELTERSLAGFAAPTWVQMAPGPILVQKRSQAVQYDVQITMNGESGEVFEVMVTTRGSPFDPGATNSAANVKEINGSGSMASTQLDSVIAGPGLVDELAFYIRGHRTTSLMDVTPPGDDFGGSNTGTIEHIHNGELHAVALGPGWNVSTGAGDAADEGGHCVEITEGAPSGSPPTNVIMGPRLITVVQEGDHLRYWPPEPHELEAACRGQTFSIYRLPVYSVADVVVVGKELT